ncbi:hypothetical protein DVH24_033907 [Malus domestica]|uniref:Uncharacterized protein n=1 Tax=Malus domestica TaxID=3750 RepID=A0A498KMA4_MALDO|nr:hypothetical protein DVH24_033907 [Malus domestica]
MQTLTSKDPEEQGKETTKKKTRTLVKKYKRGMIVNQMSIHTMIISPSRRKKKAKYIYVMSDSESPSIVPSQSQPLEPIIEKGKEQPKVQSPLNPITKETVKKPAKKIAKNPPKKPKQIKEKFDKRYHLPASTRAYKLLEDETKEKFKKYYRQEKMDYFWMQPRQGSMATELVVLKTNLTSLFVDGAIDANIIDASFYVMSENESKTGQQQNLYLPSFILNNMEIEKSKSDQEHSDQTLKIVLQDNVDKVGKIFILIKHYFHFSLVVWDIKDGKMTHYNSKLPRIHGYTDQYFDHVLQVEEVFAKRAQIATILVNHENSYANGLKKILEDRRRQNKHGQYNDIPDEDFITLA